MTTGILCEKPSAARNFAKALGGMSGTYKGEEYVICALRGHLFELAQPEKQVSAALADKYKSWDLGNLPWDLGDFSWKQVRRKDTASVFNAMKSTLSKCDKILIATDDDPSGEGELLAWEALDAANLRPKAWGRLYFADESAKSIQKAWDNQVALKDMESDPDYKKAWFRNRWDFASMQFTRVATKVVPGAAVLRQGRLKSAMVLLIGDALKAYNDYKPVPFFENRFRDENGVVYTDPDAERFKTKAEVPGGLSASAVVKDSAAEKKTAPPKLLDIAGVSAMMAPKGFTADAVLKLYQKMYESQVLSYPRTEDHCVTLEQFNELLPKVDAIASVVGADASALTHRTPRSTHVKEGMAHGANRPGPNVPSSLSELDSKFGAGAGVLYEIVARSYLTMLAEDHVYEQQKGHVADYPAYVGTVNIPKSAGWKGIFDADADDSLDEEGAAGLGTRAEPFVHEGVPPRPPYPTQKWLCKQLERYNVGTGATRVSILAETQKGKYPLVKDFKGRLSLTEYGDASYQLLPGTHIGDIHLSEAVFAQMDDVAAGKADPEELLAGIAVLVKEDIETMKANAKRGTFNMSNASYHEKEYAHVTWNGEEKKFNRNHRGHRFTDEEVERLERGERVQIRAHSNKTGNDYDWVCWLEDGLTFTDDKGEKRTYFGCNGDFPGKDKGTPVCPSSFCQHTFTDKEKADLEAGCRVHIDGFVSKKTGNAFGADCTLEWKEDPKWGDKWSIVFHFDD